MIRNIAALDNKYAGEWEKRLDGAKDGKLWRAMVAYILQEHGT